MPEPKAKTIGQAIDEIIAALSPLDEKSRPTAIRAAIDQLGIKLDILASRAISLGPSAQQEGLPTAYADVAPGSRINDIRSLKADKDPATAQEMACLVAYYLQELAPPHDRKSEIGAADLEKYFKQADFPLPKRIGQILVDARAAGYFDSPGQGSYKLNPVGYNLVAHTLPRKSAAPKPSRGKASKTRKKRATTSESSRKRTR